MRKLLRQTNKKRRNTHTKTSRARSAAKKQTRRQEFYERIVKSSRHPDAGAWLNNIISRKKKPWRMSAHTVENTKTDTDRTARSHDCASNRHPNFGSDGCQSLPAFPPRSNTQRPGPAIWQQRTDLPQRRVTVNDKWRPSPTRKRRMWETFTNLENIKSALREVKSLARVDHPKKQGLEHGQRLLRA